MEQVLITGGAGFIGSSLANELAKKYSVCIFDDFSTGQMENIPMASSVKIINGSIINQQQLEAVLSTHEFTYIYHLAAVVSVQDSILNPLKSQKINQTGLLILCELIRKYQHKLKRLLFTSSSAVYGATCELPIHEGVQMNPLSPYAIDKMAAEQYLWFYRDTYQVPVTVVRLFNVYGPRQRANSPYSGVMALLINHYLFLESKKAPFIVYGDGLQTRDYIYIKDVIHALEIVATHPQSEGNVYNIGTGIETSLFDVIQKLESLFNKEGRLEYHDQRAGDIKRSVANIQSLQALGFRSEWSLEKAVVDYVQLLKKI